MPLVESVIQKRMISKLGHGTEAVDIGPADDRVSRSLQSSSSAHPPAIQCRTLNRQLLQVGPRTFASQDIAVVVK